MLKLESGQFYDLIRTNIMFSRGLNGLDCVTFRNVEVIDIKDGVVKLAEPTLNDDNTPRYYKIHYINLDNITYFVKRQARTKYMVRKGYCGWEVELTDEEVKFNQDRCIHLSRA